MSEPVKVSLDADVVAATDNYLFWCDTDVDADDMPYHLELNNITVHFSATDVQELIALAEQIIDRMRDYSAAERLRRQLVG